MPPATHAHPALRLALHEAPAHPASRPRIIAATTGPLDPADPRWVLAVRTANDLDGGAAAILPPQRREALMRLAADLGLRPFDASLIIAIVQDAARTGRHPLDSPVEQSLSLIREPREEPVPVWQHLVAASILGAMLCWGLVRWVIA